MEITKDLVEHVARTANLHLADEQIVSLLKDFKDILNLFSEIEKADTTGIKPSFHPLALKNNSRADIPEASLPQETALSLTKKKREQYFLGPKTL